MSGPVVTVTWARLPGASDRKPTISEALAARLGRAPTHAEECAEVRRILSCAAES